VDWFCFWLKNEEDPIPAKAEQYARWRALRELQQEKKPSRKQPHQRTKLHVNLERGPGPLLLSDGSPWLH
jgi:hypothetical protein